MKFLVVKANHDFWHKVETYNSLEDLISSMERRHTHYIIEHNSYYGEAPEEIMECCANTAWAMTLEEAAEISTLKYNILIYNDYIS